MFWTVPVVFEGVLTFCGVNRITGLTAKEK
jgi:hypothetical protein